MTFNVTIRDMDEKIYRKMKSKAVERGKKIAEATAEAYGLWVSESGKKKASNSLIDLFEHPNDWGVKTNASENLDKYIYQ